MSVLASFFDYDIYVPFLLYEEKLPDYGKRTILSNRTNTLTCQHYKAILIPGQTWATLEPWLLQKPDFSDFGYGSVPKFTKSADLCGQRRKRQFLSSDFA